MVLNFSAADLIPETLQASSAFIRSLLEEIYPIARASILKQYETASRVTPYAATMVGRTKRSGKKVTSASPPSPPFGIDTGKFKAGLERLKTIEATTLFIYSDVFYAEFLLAKFAAKSPIGGIGIQQRALVAIQSKIVTKTLSLWAERIKEFTNTIDLLIKTKGWG